MECAGFPPVRVPYDYPAFAEPDLKMKGVTNRSMEWLRDQLPETEYVPLPGQPRS